MRGRICRVICRAGRPGMITTLQTRIVSPARECLVKLYGAPPGRAGLGRTAPGQDRAPERSATARPVAERVGRARLPRRGPRHPALPAAGRCVDRDAVAVEVITRLGARHSGWNSRMCAARWPSGSGSRSPPCAGGAPTTPAHAPSKTGRHVRSRQSDVDAYINQQREHGDHGAS